MYRSSVEGLTEQVRALEEQKQKLEAELSTVRRILWPRRLLRYGLGLLLLVMSGVLGGVITCRRSLGALEEARAMEERAALRRIALCNERLAAALRSPRDPKPDDGSAQP